MTPMQMLEKLVVAKIGFKIHNGHYFGQPMWQLWNDDYNSAIEEPSDTVQNAITALYEAALKAYPERFK